MVRNRRFDLSTLRRLDLLVVVLFLVTPIRAAAGEQVFVHNRGKEIRLEGEPAEEVKRICGELLRRSRSEGGIVSTDEIVWLRANEVVVEIHYDEPQSFELQGTNERSHAQDILVPLTGKLTDAGRDTTVVFTGRSPGFDLFAFLARPLYVNPPDDRGVQYGGMHSASNGLQQLREVVVRLGVEAPAATPEPTASEE